MDVNINNSEITDQKILDQTKSYQNKNKNFTLDKNKKSIMFVYGRSGAGKSEFSDVVQQFLNNDSNILAKTLPGDGYYHSYDEQANILKQKKQKDNNIKNINFDDVDYCNIKRITQDLINWSNGNCIKTPCYKYHFQEKNEEPAVKSVEIDKTLNTVIIDSIFAPHILAEMQKSQDGVEKLKNSLIVALHNTSEQSLENRKNRDLQEDIKKRYVKEIEPKFCEYSRNYIEVLNTYNGGVLFINNENNKADFKQEANKIKVSLGL